MSRLQAHVRKERGLILLRVLARENELRQTLTATGVKLSEQPSRRDLEHGAERLLEALHSVATRDPKP